MFVHVLVLVLAVVGRNDAAIKLGDLLTPCSLKASDLDDCLTTQGRALIPHFIAGVKDWGVVPMDPLFVPLMELQRTDGGPIGINIRVKNATQHGWKDMELQSIKMDPKTYNFVVRWRFPKYVMLGTAETSGRLLLLPISGTGASNITFINVDNELKLKTVPENKGTKTFLKVTDVKSSNNVERMYLTLENLFGNSELSQSMNKVLNDNNKEIYEELRPNIQDVFAEIISSILTRFFAKVPLNQLFQDV